MLLAHDIPVLFAAGAIPTQMTSYEVVERGAACGVMITASHNPWTDNGFKIKSPTGAAADPAILAAVEAGHPRPRRRAAAAPRLRGRARRPGCVERFDPYAGYEAYVRRTLDLDRLQAAGHARAGRSALWLGCRLDRRGCWRAAASSSTRSTASATPGSAASTRSPSARTSTRRWPASREGGYDLGLLLDGDADRAGAVDEQGTFIHQLQVHGPAHVLPARAPRRARSRSSPRSTRPPWSAGSASATAWRSTRRPVGFKYVGPRMIETGAMMGGEESGGYGFGMHLPERDGIYADLLLLDLFVREREAGRWPVSAAVAHLHDIAGPSFYLRDDVHADRAAYPALKARLLVELGEHAPATPGRAAGGAHGRARHGRRLQVLDRRRLLAAGPLQRHRAPGARLHGGQQRRAARRPAWPRAAAWSAARTRGDDGRRRRRAAASSTTSRRMRRARPGGHARRWSPRSRTSSRTPGASRAR